MSNPTMTLQQYYAGQILAAVLSCNEFVEAFVRLPEPEKALCERVHFWADTLIKTQSTWKDDV